MTKADAQAQINDFVQQRKFFAHPKFTKEFTTENICGVYFPYMIVDINAHSKLSGTAEKLIRSYEVEIANEKETFYDADAYHVEREFDIAIDDLTIESSKDKLDVNSTDKTTNIINSIMPFDTENMVKFDANYLKGCTSEKRDVNVGQLKHIVKAQAGDVAKFAANETLDYDRGVSWKSEEFDIKGQSWNSAYLPVWLYSYMEKKDNKELLHYVAVNARTKETMGSVPVNTSKLLMVSILITIFGGFIAFLLGTDLVTEHLGKEISDYRWTLTLSGVAFYTFMYTRYRNSSARHTYELETKHIVSNLVKVDTFFEHRTRLENSVIEGENGSKLNGVFLSINEEAE